MADPVVLALVDTPVSRWRHSPSRGFSHGGRPAARGRALALRDRRLLRCSPWSCSGGQVQAPGAIQADIPWMPAGRLAHQHGDPPEPAQRADDGDRHRA